MTFTELRAAITAVIPGASFGEDNDGQIIIYTNKKIAWEDVKPIETEQLNELEDGFDMELEDYS